jgi:hypothetical protein
MVEYETPEGLLTEPVERDAWWLIDNRQILVVMTKRDRRRLFTLVLDEVQGSLERLPHGVPQVVLDAFVDVIHVALAELAHADDPFEYEDLYLRKIALGESG